MSILALADAGVTDFIAAEFARGPDRQRTRSLLKAVIAGSSAIDTELAQRAAARVP